MELPIVTATRKDERAAKQTPVQRAMEQAAREAELYELEQELLRDDDDQEPFRRLMRRLGRSN